MGGTVLPRHTTATDTGIMGTDEGGRRHGRRVPLTTRLDTGPRLPTEAEWEVLARGGTVTPWPVEEEALGTLAGTAANSGWVPHVAAGKRANEFGLYDMTGNVWEWTGYTQEHRAGADPLGEGDAGWEDIRGIRGGSFGNSARFACSAFRGRGRASFRNRGLGFRLVRPPRPR